MAVRILLVLVAVAVVCGCGQASSSVEKQESKREAEQANETEAHQPAPGPATQPSASAEGGVIVGEAVAEAELGPVGDSGTSGTAVFEEVGRLGVQVELKVSGLPTKIFDTVYFAQVHEGSCSDKRTGEGHEDEHNASSLGPSVALVRLDNLLAEGPGLEAHGGHEHGIPEVPPGSIDQPISFEASADGSAFVSSLLEGVVSRRLTSGGAKYVDVHAARTEGSPEDLACGDLKATKEKSW